MEQLNNKLNNADDMLKFYKEQALESKEDIKQLNKSIADKENTHKAEITDKENNFKAELEALKEKNIKELDKMKAEVEEKLNSKHEVELDKKNLEIDKLKNMINNLQDKLKEKSNIRK